MQFVRSLIGSLAMPVTAALILLAFGSPAAFAQVGPPGNHYLVYRASPPVPGGFPVSLRDQFTNPDFTNHIADPMLFFANPVEKNGEPILDPLLHQSWWQITPRPFTGRVLVTNQFGEDFLDVFDAQFLLNPALKNPPVPGPQPPPGDHYECYRARGPFQPRSVTLKDQFGTFQGEVLFPEWLCNPTEKIFQARTYPIERPDLHYVCYRVQVTPQIQPQPITFLDEFRFGDTTLYQQEWLCVPSFKQVITPADPRSWGSVKAIYR